MVNTHYLQLHPQIQLSKGYSRSILIDLYTANYWHIHNDFANLLENHPTIQISALPQHLPYQTDADIKQFINLLLSEDLGSLSPIPLQPKPLLFENQSNTAIVHTISVETNQKMPILAVETINECFGDFENGTLEFHCQTAINLYAVLELYSTSTAKNIHLFIHYNDTTSYDFNQLCKFAPKLKKVTIFEAPREKTDKKRNCTLTYLTPLSDQIHQKYSLLHQQPVIQTWQTNHNYFYKRVHITHRGDVKNAFESKYRMGNVLTEHLTNIIQKKEFQALWHISKNQIDVCNDCEFRAICIDRRVPKKRANGTWFAKEECAYNPYICKEISEKDYLNLNQCGVYCRGQGFRIDVERFIEIRRRILAID